MDIQLFKWHLIEQAITTFMQNKLALCEDKGTRRSAGRDTPEQEGNDRLSLRPATIAPGNEPWCLGWLNKQK